MLAMNVSKILTTLFGSGHEIIGFANFCDIKTPDLANSQLLESQYDSRTRIPSPQTPVLF